MMKELSVTNQAVVCAYEKGYRVVNGNVISPFSDRTRALRLHIDKSYPRYRFSIGVDGRGRYSIDVHKLLAYQKYGEKMFKEGVQVRNLDNDSLNNSEDNIVLGTMSDNMMDRPKEVRQRLSVGASTHIRKFTDREMEEIRALRKKGNSYAALMKRFGISSTGTLYYILNTDYQTKV